MMKNLSIIFCFLMLSSGNIWAQAPSYTDFEWDIFGAGLAVPVGEDELSTGFTFGGEVRYNVTDAISIGLGSDFSFFDFIILDKVEEQDVSLGYSSTGFVSGDYYFNTTSSSRPFVGLALGSSDIGDIEFTEEGEESTIVEGISGMSIAPRFGYEYGHARFLLHYNIGLKKELSNYLAFKVSLTLWGGYQGDGGS